MEQPVRLRIKVNPPKEGEENKSDTGDDIQQENHDFDSSNKSHTSSSSSNSGKIEIEIEMHKIVLKHQSLI